MFYMLKILSKVIWYEALRYYSTCIYVYVYSIDQFTFLNLISCPTREKETILYIRENNKIILKNVLLSWNTVLQLIMGHMSATGLTFSRVTGLSVTLLTICCLVWKARWVVAIFILFWCVSVDRKLLRNILKWDSWNHL